MSNINGKVYAMNAITPMKPWKTWILRGFFFLLGHIKPLQKDLIDLSFIEFARWVVLPRKGFPFLGNSQVKEDLKYDYLLFFSNFNGTWNQYIDAFSAVLSKGLNLVWRWSEKFPGSVPVTSFKEYIARVQFDTTTTSPRIPMPQRMTSNQRTSCSRRWINLASWPSSAARSSLPMLIYASCCKSSPTSAKQAKLQSLDREDIRA